MQTYGEEMGITASSEQIDAALDRAQDQLQNKTAQVVIENLVMDESTSDRRCACRKSGRS